MSLLSSLFSDGKIYLIIYLWLFVLVVLECLKGFKPYRVIAAFSTAVLLAIFTGIRWETGTDWPAYSNLFDNLELNWTFLLNVYNFDLGYVLFNALIKCFTNSYTIFLLIDSILAVGLIFWFLKKNSPYPNLSLFVFYNAFFVSQFMGSNRRIIALGLILFACCFIFNRNKIKYAYSYFVAGLFHSTAFLTIITYFIPRKRFSTKQLIIGLSASLLIGIFQLPFKFLQLLGGLATSMSGNALADRLIIYSGNTEDEIVIGNTNPVVLVTLSVIKRCIFLIFYLIVIKKKKGILDPLTDFFFNIYILGFVIYMLLNGSMVFQIISTYFTFIEIALIGRMWGYAESRLKMVFLGVLFIYGFFQLLSALSAYPELYMPYKTFI